MGTLVCFHVANAVANCIKLLLNLIWGTALSSPLFRMCSYKRDWFFACMCACTAIKEYYVYPATIVKCWYYTSYCTCKGIHIREIANCFCENRHTDLRDILLRKYRLLWSPPLPKKNHLSKYHLSEPSIDHIRNMKYTHTHGGIDYRLYWNYMEHTYILYVNIYIII